MNYSTKGWVRKGHGDIVIVFLHGILSNSEKCWTSNNSTYWPELVSNDLRLSHTGIYMCEFFTSKKSGDYGISDCASEVLRQLTLQGENETSTPIEYKKILFVAHSTGGIVARYIVESNLSLFKNKHVGFCLYASPSFGSKIASYLKPLFRLFDNKLFQELEWGNSQLADLDFRFKRILASTEVTISGFEAFENKRPVRFLPKVVDSSSAARYFPNVVNIPNSTHSTISKPDSTEDESHKVLVEYIQNNFPQVIEHKSKVTTSKLSSSHNQKALFEFYSPSIEKYYVGRKFDNTINNQLLSRHLWIYGLSGVGKTAAIHRAIHKSKKSFKYISLGYCLNLSISEIITEIYVKLTDSESPPLRAHDAIRKTSNEITKYCQHNDLVLFIEEIPVSKKSEFDTLCKNLYALINDQKDNSRFKIIISTINQPPSISGTELQRLEEYMSVLEAPLWENTELDTLINLIIDNHPELKGREEAADFYSGTPRNVKNHFRDSAI